MPSSPRLRSIDLLRGLTILTMIFVNDVASVANIPWWMKHMPQEADGMTFVDVVFPAFLFIVGMSIPFALDKRLRESDSVLGVIKHILVRTAGLLFLGVLMVNMHDVNAAATGISRSLWMLLVFLAAIPLWTVFPKDRRRLGQWIKILSFLFLLVLMFIYRGGPDGNVHWLKTSWWGILGLIGWAYCFSSLLYLALQRRTEFMVAMLGLFTLVFIGDKAGFFSSLSFIREYLYIGGHIGGHSLITCAGVAAAMMIRDEARLPKYSARLTVLLAFAGSLALLAYALAPYYGINKVGATPSWGLYSAALCIVLFALIYWVVDIRKQMVSRSLLDQAGENPLLAYILPDIYYALLGILGLSFADTIFASGLPGIIRSVLVAVLAVQLTGVATKHGLRMRF